MEMAHYWPVPFLFCQMTFFLLLLLFDHDLYSGLYSILQDVYASLLFLSSCLVSQKGRNTQFDFLFIPASVVI